MENKRIFAAFGVALLSFVAFGKSDAASSKIEGIKVQMIKNINELQDESLENSEDPVFVFNKSISDYKNEFAEYLNIVGLNAFDKEDIELPGFDADYIAPEYGKVMFDYQDKLEKSLSDTELQKYESLMKQEYCFDRYVALNKNMYKDLNIDLKYNHDIKPTNPLTPITPINPKINPIGSTTSKVAAVATAGIVTILAEAGLGEAVIAAFTSSVSTMTIGLSTSWIPFIGWALAVALVVGALIALTVIIIQNWRVIRQTINEIKAWFMEQFSTFSSIISDYFGDIVSKGEESVVVGRDRIGNKDITWTESEIKVDAIAMSVAQKMDKTTVSLLRNVKKRLNPLDEAQYAYFWKTETKVDEKFVIGNHLYDYGISTYTWYNNTARRLMQNGGSSKILADKNGEMYKVGYHTFLQTESRNMNGWNHYHIFKRDILSGVFKSSEDNPDKKAHSFFGPMFLRKTPYSNDYDGFPEMRNL